MNAQEGLLRALWSEMAEPRVNLASTQPDADFLGLGDGPSDFPGFYGWQLTQLLLLREACAWYNAGLRVAVFSRNADFDRLIQLLPASIENHNAVMRFGPLPVFDVSPDKLWDEIDAALWDLNDDRLRFITRLLVDVSAEGWDLALKEVSSVLDTAVAHGAGWMTDQEVDQVAWAMVGAESSIVPPATFEFMLESPTNFALPAGWRANAFIEKTQRFRELQATIERSLAPLVERNVLRLDRGDRFPPATLALSAPHLLRHILVGSFGLEDLHVVPRRSDRTWSVLESESVAEDEAGNGRTLGVYWAGDEESDSGEGRTLPPMGL